MMSGYIIEFSHLPRGSATITEGGAANANLRNEAASRTSKVSEDPFFAVKSLVISENGTYKAATSGPASE